MHLDAKIAAILADEAATSSAISDLILEVESALPINAKEIDHTRLRMADPRYENPTIARSALAALGSLTE